VGWYLLPPSLSPPIYRSSWSASLAWPWSRVSACAESAAPSGGRCDRVLHHKRISEARGRSSLQRDLPVVATPSPYTRAGRSRYRVAAGAPSLNPARYSFLAGARAAEPGLRELPRPRLQVSKAVLRRRPVNCVFSPKPYGNTAMDYSDVVDRTAIEMIKRFRSAAAHTARELAEIVEECQHDQFSAERWRDIADMVERLWPKPWLRCDLRDATPRPYTYCRYWNSFGSDSDRPLTLFLWLILHLFIVKTEITGRFHDCQFGQCSIPTL